MVSFCSLKISLWNACTVLVFFIAGLLSVALRARRPLGAYRIPPETGLLIPSEKRGYRQLTISRFPYSDKTTSRGVADEAVVDCHNRQWGKPVATRFLSGGRIYISPDFFW